MWIWSWCQADSDVGLILVSWFAIPTNWITMWRFAIACLIHAPESFSFCYQTYFGWCNQTLWIQRTAWQIKLKLLNTDCFSFVHLHFYTQSDDLDVGLILMWDLCNIVAYGSDTFALPDNTVRLHAWFPRIHLAICVPFRTFFLWDQKMFEIMRWVGWKLLCVYTFTRSCTYVTYAGKQHFTFICAPFVQCNSMYKSHSCMHWRFVNCKHEALAQWQVWQETTTYNTWII